MRESIAQFSKNESALAVTQAVLWRTVPVETLKTRKRKVKLIARAKQSKGFVKGTAGFAAGYPRKGFA